MVKALIDSLIELGELNEDIIVLVADDGEVYHALSTTMPDRTINIGISECNAISVGAGMASCGHMPFVVGGNSFLAYRGYEFIRNQLCMQSRNVKVIGIGAGMAISVLGNTQHATEDISALRVLPKLTIMTPATPTEVKKMLRIAAELNGPVFLRIGRSSGRDFYKDGFIFEPYKIQKVIEGTEALIFASGSIVCDAVEAAQQLGGQVGVVNVHTIKPIDRESIVDYSMEGKKWLILEEHNVGGGLGGAIAETVIDERLNVEMYRMGLRSHFPIGYGTYQEIKEQNGLSVSHICKKCMEILGDDKEKR